MVDTAEAALEAHDEANAPRLNYNEVTGEFEPHPKGNTTMITAVLLASQLVCPPPHCPQPYPFYHPYFNPYIVRMPTPDSLKPPPFTVRPAPLQPQRERPAVRLPASVYGTGGGPVIIENPYYKPGK